ncbi:hypothetical protein PMIN04_001679 [Paraphaeosphaeria minitans]
MYERASTLVLRCELCNKPFDKPSTLKRHGYYCRSRRVGTTTRPRSCIACARGKARCDNRRPECSRCVAKSIECYYPPSPRKGTGTKSYSPTVSGGLDGVPMSPEGNDEMDISVDASPTAVPDINVENSNWEDADIDFSDFLNSPVLAADMGDPSAPEYHSLVRHSSPSTSTSIHIPDLVIPAAFDFSIPPVPTISTHSLVLKSKARPGSHRVVTLILHTLKSYPQMMLRDGTLPPYVHPHLVSSDFNGNDMESLSNCISLVHMISHKVRGSRKLFWKNVRLECERMSTEPSRFSNWELLAAMHALSLYILIRMSEGVTNDNNFDQLLLSTMAVTATHLARSDATFTPLAHSCDTHACWLEWVYMESRRRLGIVFRVINLIVYFDPGAMCSLQSDLVLAPLPAKRSLWEAPDEFAWKAERDKQSLPRCAFGLATSGELVRLDEMDLYGGYGKITKQQDHRTSDQNWEEWCSGMDSFGGLVMLAASLVG